MTQKFKTNDNGGWIIPAGTIIPDVIPAHSVLGDDRGCRFGDCEITESYKFDDWCDFGHECVFGNNCSRNLK